MLLDMLVIDKESSDAVNCPCHVSKVTPTLKMVRNFNGIIVTHVQMMASIDTRKSLDYMSSDPSIKTRCTA